MWEGSTKRMGENINPFVRYLNGLHNYNAQNPNAYCEKNVESPYYGKIMVEMDICQHIIQALSNYEPHILVLTGHAGDGKTSLMYQVLSRLRVAIDFSMPLIDVNLPNGNTCCCIKDFSELSEDKKLEVMKKIVAYPGQGKHVFMVANTGPLINTFGELFDDEEVAERAKMELISTMDGNKGEIVSIEQYSFLVINVAAIDNTSFPGKFVNKIIDDSLWEKCGCCSKKSYCHMYHNQQLIKENKSRVVDFLKKYYIWETEYGHRLTIRSMTEQLAYMITGGMECEDVLPGELHKMLFFNLFFGYIGTFANTQAQNILAIKLVEENHFEMKRLRADEELIIRRNYDKLFSENVASIIRNAERGNIFFSGWAEEVRRAYFFLNIVSDEDWRRDVEDIFSKQYMDYLDVRDGVRKPTKNQKTLIVDALRMIYLGTVISESNMIPITLSKEYGIAQSVQLVVGELNESEIEVLSQKDSVMNKMKNNMILRIRKGEEIALTLPMMNYFEELRNGIISTNIDPQLSHGIESMKAQLLNVVFEDDDDLEIIIMNNAGYEKKKLSVENDYLYLN